MFRQVGPCRGTFLRQEAIKDLTTSVTLRRDLARTTPLFREALRLVAGSSDHLRSGQGKRLWQSVLMTLDDS